MEDLINETRLALVTEFGWSEDIASRIKTDDLSFMANSVPEERRNAAIVASIANYNLKRGALQLEKYVEQQQQQPEYTLLHEPAPESARQTDQAVPAQFEYIPAAPLEFQQQMQQQQQPAPTQFEYTPAAPLEFQQQTEQPAPTQFEYAPAAPAEFQQQTEQPAPTQFEYDAAPEQPRARTQTRTQTQRPSEFKYRRRRFTKPFRLPQYHEFMFGAGRFMPSRPRPQPRPQPRPESQSQGAAPWPQVQVENVPTALATWKDIIQRVKTKQAFRAVYTQLLQQFPPNVAQELEKLENKHYDSGRTFSLNFGYRVNYPFTAKSYFKLAKPIICLIDAIDSIDNTETGENTRHFHVLRQMARDTRSKVTPTVPQTTNMLIEKMRQHGTSDCVDILLKGTEKQLIHAYLRLQ